MIKPDQIWDNDRYPGELQGATDRIHETRGIWNMSNETILQEAQRLVHGDRGADYGHPLDDFTKTAKLWEVVLKCPVTPEQIALCMCMVKISRELNRHKRDNLADLCGYAETYMMVKDERARREELVTTFCPPSDLEDETRL